MSTPEPASYVVVIRRAADGVERRAVMPYPWDKGDYDDWFWWTQGNYSCDCNRYLTFERAGGHEPEMDDPACECSDGKYLVLRFELSDGHVIDGPDTEPLSRD